MFWEKITAKTVKNAIWAIFNSAGTAATLDSYGKDKWEESENTWFQLNNSLDRNRLDEDSYGLVEREKIKEWALDIALASNLSSFDIASDVGGLVKTGNFNSYDDILNFDALLRQFLFLNEKESGEVNDIMKQIIEAVQNGDNLQDVLDRNDVDFENINQYIDGESGISLIDLQAYLYEKQIDIAKNYSNMKLSPRDQKLVDEDNKQMEKRKIRIEPTISLSEEHEAIWQDLGVSEFEHGSYTYTLFPNGKEQIYYSLPYDSFTYSPDDPKTRTKYELEHARLLKAFPKSIPEIDAYYEWSLPSPEELEMFNAEQKELRQKNGKETYDANEQNALATGQAVQNVGIVGVSEEDLNLLYDINSNVSAIYGAMGLNNSQVVAEASDGYNSWTATTEMISNINNELSYNNIFQKNSVNHFIGISRDFDSVFSELYAMKGQLVSLLNEQKSAKDTLDTLSKRENNCLGWVTDLGSTSRIVSTAIVHKDR